MRWITLLLLLFTALPVSATDHHVAASGSDENPGTEALPWASLGYALSQASCGDRILILDSATYFERVTVDHACTDGSPLRIEAQGGTPFIDGGFPEGRTTPNTDWEVVDAANHVYATVQTYPPLSGEARGWFKAGGEWHRLIPYPTRADLECDHQLAFGTCLYFGYGVFYEPLDGRIYFRGLEPSEMVIWAGVTAYGHLDPRQTEIRLYDDEDTVKLDGSAHVMFDGIGVRSGGAAFEFEGTSSYSEVRNSPGLSGGRVTLRFRDGYRFANVENNVIEGGFPAWVAWADVKGFGRFHGGNELQGKLIDTDGSNISDIDVQDNVIRRGWDVWGGGGDRPRLVGNTIVDVRDDVTEFQTTARWIEISRNTCLHCANLIGADLAGNPVTPGPLETNRASFNVVDLYDSKLHCRRIGVLPGNLDCGTTSNILHGKGGVWSYDHFVVEHGLLGSQGWSIYHNTIRIGRTRSTFGLGWTRAGMTWSGERTRIFNNIVVQEDDAPINRGASTGIDDNVEIDGNIYHAPRLATEAPFRLYSDERGIEQSFDSLAELLGSSVWADSQIVYPPGWETNSIEADPMLDAALCPDPQGPAASARVALLPWEFPGTFGVDFSGALDPDTCEFPPEVLLVPSLRAPGSALLVCMLVVVAGMAGVRARA